MPSPRVVLLALSISACSAPGPQPNVSVMFHISPPRFYCDDATVVALGQGGSGGYRFDCEATGESLEVAYRPRGQSVELAAITLNAQQTQDIVLAAERDVLAERGLPACEDAQSVDLDTFIAPPLPMDGNHLAYGGHTVRLAHPCGEGVLQLGKPLRPGSGGREDDSPPQ